MQGTAANSRSTETMRLQFGRIILLKRGHSNETVIHSALPAGIELSSEWAFQNYGSVGYRAFRENPNTVLLPHYQMRHATRHIYPVNDSTERDPGGITWQITKWGQYGG